MVQDKEREYFREPKRPSGDKCYVQISLNGKLVHHTQINSESYEHCQGMRCDSVFLVHGHQARWSAEACFYYLQSYGAENLFFSIPENLFDRAFLWHYWGSGSQTLDDSQKHVFRLFKHYLK